MAGHNSRLALAGALACVALLMVPAPTRAQVSLRTVVEMAQRNSSTVRLAQVGVQRASAALAESHDVFIPSLNFGSGLPVFPEVGFTGNLPTIWDANVQSLAFSMSQIRYTQAARMGFRAAELSLSDAREQVALDASDAYLELDTVNRELAAAHQQEDDAARLVEIEQQRAEAGVDPLSQVLQARLTAAEIKLSRLHLETRAATLAKQISELTGLPAGSIVPDHASIPEIPALTGDAVPRRSAALDSAEMMARSKERAAKGDEERAWTPTFGFGVLYNRNTTLLNSINNYYRNPLPANNFSSGISITVPLFNMELRAQARASAADALRAKVEAEQAERQNEIQIVELDSSLRELETETEIASLKQQIADEQLKTVTTQLELGNGAGNAAGAPAPPSPQAEQQALIDERAKYEDALDARLQLSEARLSLLRALGHMQDWLNELQIH